MLLFFCPACVQVAVSKRVECEVIAVDLRGHGECRKGGSRIGGGGEG